MTLRSYLRVCALLHVALELVPEGLNVISACLQMGTEFQHLICGDTIRMAKCLVVLIRRTPLLRCIAQSGQTLSGALETVFAKELALVIG